MDRSPAPDDYAANSLIGLANNCHGEPLYLMETEAIIAEQ